MANLTALKSFLCVDNPIAVFPEGLCRIKGLEYINMDYNRLEFIPESIKNLKNLKKLLLRGNALQSYPVEFESLVKLEELKLSDNQIKTVDANCILPANLKILDLNSNQLSVIPDSFFSKSILNDLNLGNNLLKSVPELFNCSRLIELKIGNNQLNAFKFKEGQMPVLEILDLSRNPISTLNSSFYSLLKLKEIDLNSCSIIELDNLFKEFKVLQILDIRNNMLKFDTKEMILSMKIPNLRMNE